MNDATEDLVPEVLLTIPEAAAHIGVSERTLYRLLKTGNFAARTVTEHRQTVTGRRLTTLLPPDLVREILQAQPPLAPLPLLAVGEAQAEEGNDDNFAANDTGNGANNAANGDRNTGGTASDDDNGDTGSVRRKEETEPGC